MGRLTAWLDLLPALDRYLIANKSLLHPLLKCVLPPRQDSNLRPLALADKRSTPELRWHMVARSSIPQKQDRPGIVKENLMNY